jgi:hypothetical protein
MSPDLAQWLDKVRGFMASDKSNDWSEELAELDEIRAEEEFEDVTPFPGGYTFRTPHASVSVSVFTEGDQSYTVVDVDTETEDRDVRVYVDDAVYFEPGEGLPY